MVKKISDWKWDKGWEIAETGCLEVGVVFGANMNQYWTISIKKFIDIVTYKTENKGEDVKMCASNSWWEKMTFQSLCQIERDY